MNDATERGAEPKVEGQRTRDGAGGVKSQVEISLKAAAALSTNELGGTSELKPSRFHFSGDSEFLGAL